MWESDTGKLLAAIDKIIKDPEKKYDECLVEQFLKLISDELQKLSRDDWIRQARTILQKLQSFVNDEAFVMMNQTRVYKTYLSVFRSNVMNEDSFSNLADHLESFWLSLGSVIINHDLAAVTAVLMTLGELVESVQVYNWMVTKKLSPSISVLVKGRTFEIGDIITMAEFYVETSENYHTRNKAELLLKLLIENAIGKHLDPSHQHFKNLKHLVIKLIQEHSSSILHILIALLENNPSSDTSKALLERFDVSTLLYERLIESSGSLREGLCTICSLLGMINDQSRFDTVLDHLKKKGQIEAIVAFLTESPGEISKSLLQSFLIGPLILRCADTRLDIESETLVHQLDSIKEHLNDKTVTTCLVRLGRIIEHKPTYFTESSTALTIRIILSYVDNFSDTPREFKNVMLCCSNLRKLLDCDNKLFQDSLQSVISTALKTLQKVDLHDENLKPIVLSLIRLLSHAQRKIVSVNETTGHVSWVDDAAQLAANCTDSDVQDEFNLVLREFHEDYCPKPDDNIDSVHLEGELIQEEYRADIKPSLDDILDYELFSENILDCY